MIGDLDLKLESQNKIVIGVDEAGRGPLCGPVVVAAVSLFRPIDGVNDSKKLSEKMRVKLLKDITENSYWQVYSVLPEIVDRKNILHATLWGMWRVVSKVYNRVEGEKIVLIDGNKLLNKFPLEQAVVKGDSKSINIAAASILAKVHRDKIMTRWSEIFPEYNLLKHKGYPTEAHYEAIKKFGPTRIHRKSFKLFKEKSPKQLSFF